MLKLIRSWESLAAEEESVRSKLPCWVRKIEL